MRFKWPSTFSPVVALGTAMTLGALVLFVLFNYSIQDFSNRLYDFLMAKTAKPPQTDSVVIVDLDDASLQALGQWPWPRYLVAELTRKIFDSGAAVVGYDIVFAEEDRTSPKVISRDLQKHLGIEVSFSGLPEKLMDYEAVLAGVLVSNKAVLGCTMIPKGFAVNDFEKDDDPYFKQVVLKRGPGDLADWLMQAARMERPIGVLYQSARVGFFNAFPDGDNIVRSNPLLWGAADRVYPSLSLEMIRLYKNANQVVVNCGDQGVEEIRINELIIPTDEMARMIVNYRQINPDISRSLSTSFPNYPAQDILNGKIGRKELEGKLVLIGTSAVGLKDIKATPLTQFFSGVEIHATIIDNILSGQVLSRPIGMLGVHVVSILLIGGFLTASIARGKSWISFLVSLGVIGFAMACSAFLLTRYQLVYTSAWVCFVTVVMHPTLTTVRFWQEERQKRQVRNMFGTMVSKSVLEYMETNPESFTLSGKRAEATVFFSDVKGFTTISESLEPEKLSVLLNRYLSPMTEIVMKRNAYVDKYIGDAVMAVWGVPYPMQDHALQGCLAALEQQEKLEEIRPILKEQFGHVVKVRMGLNSGAVTAGNMGSDIKFSYTVMGDTVNQAARFEPTNKDYGTQIIIGETTFEAAKSGIEARLLDRILVQGKTKPIRIYELVGKKGGVPAPKLERYRKFEQALELHWNREWDAAEEILDGILADGEEDSPSVNLLTRIRYYRIHPPGSAWSGEYIRASKD